MNLERMRRLERLMDSYGDQQPKDKPVRFDMTTWVTVNCETAACALGSAALLPSFNKQGLTLKQGVTRVKDDGTKLVEFIPQFEGRTDYDAGAQFFDIDIEASLYIFGATNKRTPRAVAKLVREVIRRDGVMTWETREKLEQAATRRRLRRAGLI